MNTKSKILLRPSSVFVLNYTNTYFLSLFKSPNKKKTSTAGVHQMRPFCRHSFIIIIIIVFVVIVVVGHFKSFQPQKS